MRRVLLVMALLFVQLLSAKEPHLSCEKKFGKMDWQGMVFHRYCLRAEHFPPQQTFRLIVKSFDGTQTETFRYYANHRGHLIFQPSEEYDGDIVAICPAMKGERLTFVMKAEDGEETYATEVVPFPLEMKSKKGITLNLEIQGVKGEKFQLFAQGFKPSEPVQLSLHIDGKETDLEAAVTSLGDLYTYVHIPPHAKGDQAELILIRKSEKIVFPFQWGAPALKLVGACCFEIK